MKRFFFFVLFVFLVAPFSVHAITTKDTGLIETGTGIFGSDQSTIDIGTYVGDKIISPIFSILGIVFLILFIYGGVLWMTGGGNPETLKKAKAILVQAVIGLLVILLSYGLTTFIFQNLTA